MSVERLQKQKVEEINSIGTAQLKLHTGPQGIEYSGDRSVSAYLSGLMMYLMALVINGLKPVDPQPVAAEKPESEAAD